MKGLSVIRKYFQEVVVDCDLCFCVSAFSNASNEAEMDEEAMLSDQESVSLLQDLPAFQSRSSAVSGSHEIKNKPELNQQKRGKLKSCRGEKSASSSRSGELEKH